MANVLEKDKQITVINTLAEGSSIRAIERITGVHRDTIMRLGVRVGQGCAALLDRKMRGFSCQHLQFDKKPRKHVTVLHFGPVTSPVLAVRAAIIQEFRLGEES
jgi:hypothetical protein